MQRDAISRPGRAPRPFSSPEGPHEADDPRRFVIRQGRAYYLTSTALGGFVAALPLFLWPDLYLGTAAAPWWVIILGAAAMIAIHEGSHAAAYWCLGGRRLKAGVRFWLHVVPMAAWVLLEDPMPRLRIAAVLLAPLVLVPTILMLILGVNPLSLLLAWLNFAGATGDLIVVGVVLRCQATMLQDTTEGLVIVR